MVSFNLLVSWWRFPPCILRTKYCTGWGGGLLQAAKFRIGSLKGICKNMKFSPGQPSEDPLLVVDRARGKSGWSNKCKLYLWKMPRVAGGTQSEGWHINKSSLSSSMCSSLYNWVVCTHIAPCLLFRQEKASPEFKDIF